MSRAPVSMMLIYRDDPLLEQAIASVRPYVRQVCIAVDHDAPTSARAAAKLLADSTVNIEWQDDFAAARNAVLPLATEPWLAWMDSDDVVVGAEHLQREISQASPFGRLLAPYDYSHDPKTGEVVIQQWRERIVPNDGNWHWEHPTHESLVRRTGRLDPANDYWMQCVRWVHKRTETGARSRSLAILRKHHAAGHNDAWTHLNLGIELHATNEYAEAINHFAEHVRQSEWQEERAIACLKAADCELALSLTHKDEIRYETALEWIKKAQAIWPNAFEPLFAEANRMAGFGIPFFGKGSHAEVAALCAKAIATPETRTPVGRRPQERNFWVYEMQRNAAMVEEDWDTAIAATEAILKNRPGSPTHVLALKQYKTQRMVAGFGVGKLEEKFSEPNAQERIAELEAELARLREERVPVTKHPRLDRPPGTEGFVSFAVQPPLDIVFHCGPSADPWNPEIIAQNGAGGSETAVVEMAARLAKLGHTVRVYNNPGVDGTFDGVDYLQWTPEVKPTCDVLVAWRMAALLPQGDAKVRLAWCHDTELIGCNYGYSLLADRFLALSKWHAGNLVKRHGIPESQVFQTRNGIDPALYESGGSRRNPHRAIYSSSWDRGLGVMLDVWPDIRKRVPDAELAVFYGASSWKRRADEIKDEQHRFLVSTLHRRMKDLAPLGVRNYGLVNKATLAREMRASGAWLYPTWWSETSCIGAMEARAAGLRIVTSPIAALPETVGPWGTYVDGDWVSDDYQAKFVEAAVKALTSVDPLTREMQANTAKRDLGWDGVAKDWTSLMRKLLDEAKHGALPAYAEFREVA